MTLFFSSCRCQRIYGSSRDSWRTRISWCTRKQREHGNSRLFSIKSCCKLIELYRSIHADLSSYCKCTDKTYSSWGLFSAVFLDFLHPSICLNYRKDFSLSWILDRMLIMYCNWLSLYVAYNNFLNNNFRSLNIQFMVMYSGLIWFCNQMRG